MTSKTTTTKAKTFANAKRRVLRQLSDDYRDGIYVSLHDPRRSVEDEEAEFQVEQRLLMRAILAVRAVRR